MAIEFGGICPLIQVYNVPTALAFYRDILGFETVAASEEVETPEGRFAHWAMLGGGSAEAVAQHRL